MRTAFSVLCSTGLASASVAAGYFAIDMIETGLAMSGNKGVMLCGLGGMYVLGAVLNVVAFYRSLPK